MSNSTAPAPLNDLTNQKRTNFRWVICALLFAATTINYVDRSVLNAVAGDLRTVIGWNDLQYGYIGAAFTLAYAIGFLIFGWVIDRVGVRIGYTISLISWSIAAAATGLARGPLGFGIARFALGLGEAGNFPSAIKTTAVWFPTRDRSFATGIFNSGSNVGAILAPLVAPWLFLTYGWQSVFVLTGLVGIVWVFFWWPLYREPESHPRVNAAELAYIQSEPSGPERKIRWRELLQHRQVWGFSLLKLLTDGVWWFYLFWSGPFLKDRFHVDLKTIGLPLIVIYGMADFGSIIGGWLSTGFMKAGWNANRARKTAMLICALLVLPVIYAAYTPDKWVAVILIGIATSAHQGFSANTFTTASDMFPKWSVASVVGLGGFFGAMGGFVLQISQGWIKQNLQSYVPVLIFCGTIYLLALLIFHLLAPRLEKVAFDDRAV